MTLPVQFHKLYIQAPECTILVALGKVQLHKLHDRISLPPDLIADVDEGYCDGFFGMSGGNIYLYLPEVYNPITTAHECIHAAGRIWDSVGAHLEAHNDEIITYTHDAIHRMIKELYDESAK